jgi:hypothetical protein
MYEDDTVGGRRACQPVVYPYRYDIYAKFMVTIERYKQN